MKPDGRPKGATSKPELYILMHMGYKPKQLIQMGFKPAMVYNYSHKYKAILERLATTLTPNTDDIRVVSACSIPRPRPLYHC